MSWTLEQAETHLLSVELFGMKFGLERMRRVLTALGSPQQAFRSIHVVGTNGKSSTVRMAAAILEAHGIRTGAYLSPHLSSFAERIRIGDADLDPDAFGAAVERAATAAAKVDRTLTGGERVTQFELLTAAAFSELAERGVEAAVVEAGLGGRHDATNVLAAPVAVLTNVGLEHTRWLGPTITDIAREKLAVVAPGSTLVVGELDPEAEAEVAKVDARVVHADPADGTPFTGFQRANFSVARAATGEFLGTPLDEAAVLRAALAHRPRPLPGRRRSAPDDLRRRAQPLWGRGARLGAARRHRREAARRGAVRARRQGRRGDAARARAARLRRGLHRQPQPARAEPRDALLAVGSAGRPCGRDRGRSPRGGREGSGARGRRRRRGGHRLDLPGRRPAVRARAPEGVGAVNPRGPGVLQMVMLVAVVVALVILVFFALGYLFGRMFL